MRKKYVCVYLDAGWGLVSTLNHRKTESKIKQLSVQLKVSLPDVRSEVLINK